MSEEGTFTSAAVDALRREFDSTFASPPATRQGDLELFLALRVGGDAYALRIHDLGGFSAARKIVTIRSPIAEMLGLAGIRGNLVPAYGLAALLGYEARESPRWFALSPGSERVALAFAELEGYLERPRSEIRAAAEGEARRAHVRERLHAPNEVRAIIELSSIVAAVEERVATATAIKEP